MLALRLRDDREAGDGRAACVDGPPSPECPRAAESVRPLLEAQDPVVAALTLTLAAARTPEAPDALAAPPGGGGDRPPGPAPRRDRRAGAGRPLTKIAGPRPGWPLADDRLRRWLKALSACVLDVELRPQSGRPGDRVAVTVRANNPADVSAMRVAVVGYGFEESLARRGAEWTAETTVPYEAGPGEYMLDVYAVDAAGNRLGTARSTFRVLN